MLTQIQQSVLVLTAMKNTMEPALQVFKRYIYDDDVKYVVHMKMLIDLSSFMEEWSRLGAICKVHPEIILTLKICEPALRRMKKWGGIRHFRNKVLAHGFREEFKSKNGEKLYSPVDMQKWYFEADVPNGYAEVLLLSEMAYFCMAVFLSRHGKQIDGLDFTYKGEVKDKGIDSSKQFDEAINDFMNHIKALDPSIESSWNGYRFLSDIMNGKT